MRAGVAKCISKIVVENRLLPIIKEGEALVKVAYAGLCGPTDYAILNGLHPRARFPLVLGHEFSGEIIDIGKNAKDIAIGDRVVINPLIWCDQCVTCKNGNQYICENLKLIGIDFDGGFQEYCPVPLSNLVRLPDSLPLNIAALCEPMAVGVHSVKEAGLRIGDSALIFGAGPIGLFTAEACRFAGASNITIIDIDEKRLKLAAELEYNIYTSVHNICETTDTKFDYVFETTGAQKVLEDVFKFLKIKGTLAIVGKYDVKAPFDLHTVLFNEITVKGMRVYRPEEFITAIEILTHEPSRYERMISDYFSIEQLEEVFETFYNRNNLSRIVVSFK